MINGRATPDSTTSYAKTHSLSSADRRPYLPLLPDGPVVSQAGFGTYRVAAGIESHEQALAHALKQGINLIDTSSNYGDGQAEKLIAQVVTQAVDAGALHRDELVVVSKAGYIQGQNLKVVSQRKKEGRPFPNVVNYAAGLDHCIDPQFLADQLSRSLERLQMDCIDVYLLHNPEYYLMWAGKWRRPLAESRRIYYQRIRAAFAHLEAEVAAGRIQWYGISSNTFPNPADDPEFTSLETVWEIAQSISENHHFRVIQLPMNLLEAGAATEQNQSGSRSVQAFAREKGLAILVNRPLNAITGDSLTRLADVFPPSYPTTTKEVSTAVDTLVDAEIDFQQNWLPRLDLEVEERRPLLEKLAIGRVLQGQWRAFGSYQNWIDVQSRFLIPRARTALQLLSNRPNLPPEVSGCS
jgi:aryl-alcohol dehydrogenase-like predicted oxidoreductase